MIMAICSPYLETRMMTCICYECGHEYMAEVTIEAGHRVDENECPECVESREQRQTQRREMRERLFKLFYDPIRELADGDERLQNELVYLVNAFGLGRENSALEILRNDCSEFVAAWLEQARRNVAVTTK